MQARAYPSLLLAPAGTLDRRRIANAIATVLVVASALFAVVLLLLILADVIFQGLPALNVAFFTERPLPPGEIGGGVAPAILGTLEMLLVASLIGIPLGVGAAIYLSEFGRGMPAHAVSFCIDLIAGFPSIVIGVFVWAWLVRNVVGEYDGLAGGVALAVIMIPILARTVEETLRLVPDAVREASLALGLPRWKTILRVVLPTARAGLVTGIVLSVARAGGESAPLLLTAFGSQVFNFDLSQPMAALPIQIYQYARSPYSDWHTQAWGAALILIALIGALSVLTRFALSDGGCVVSQSEAKTTPAPLNGPLAAQKLGGAPIPIGRPGLDVRELSAWYGERQAIGNVSLGIAPHKVTAVIGPSGCGKSTMLRCLNRMHEVERGARAQGHVTVNGQDIYAPGVDPVRVRRVIGMVFQKPNPFPMMTIYDNVVAGLKLQGGYRSRELEQIAQRALQQAALWDEVKDVWKKASGVSLSSGQQQRLCIARTLAVEPAVILMDEPCSALDPIATYRIEELITELKPDYTIAIVTHNMQQASRVSDYTAFMLAEADRIGRLIEFGPTSRIFTNPTQRRTEDYITGRFG